MSRVNHSKTPITKYFKLGFVELFEGIKMPLTVNSPTACGRSPLGEGALGRG